MQLAHVISDFQHNAVYDLSIHGELNAWRERLWNTIELPRHHSPPSGSGGGSPGSSGGASPSPPQSPPRGGSPSPPHSPPRGGSQSTSSGSSGGDWTPSSSGSSLGPGTGLPIRVGALMAPLVTPPGLPLLVMDSIQILQHVIRGLETVGLTRAEQTYDYITWDVTRRWDHSSADGRSGHFGSIGRVVSGAAATVAPEVGEDTQVWEIRLVV